MSNRCLSFIVWCLGAGILLGGCASNQVVGAQGWTRSARVGDEIVIRLPATMAKTEWRLVSFDSTKVTPRNVFLVLEGTGRDARWVGRFIARFPGNTEIIYARHAAAPEAGAIIGERRRFPFRITE